ncbi:MAG: hypothetical protein NZ902_02805 [Acidilobaceae archaeon]|nr:hypothetical protein [Acidilobaceae archaeon]MCX8165750.1 hypothetical protein [Acidilobaceae archaeon]MDW7974175.1 hypothetical protein [Sulfolobales archaeon]
MVNERALRALYVLLLIPILFSVYVHSPLFDPQPYLYGLKYTDFTIGVFLPVFQDPVDSSAGRGRWFNEEKIGELLGGKRTCPIPYLDYHFEYPPLVGLMWLFSTCVSLFSVAPPSFPPADYGNILQRVVQLHYYITAGFLFLSYLGIVFALPALALERRRPLLLLLMPSMYVFSVYNWDVVAAAFFLLSIYAIERQRYGLSGVLAGLSVSTKLLTLFGGVLLGLTLLREGRRGDFLRYSAAFLAAAALPYAAVLLLSPHGFSHMISHHATWYCENCLYMLVSNDIWSNTHRVLAALSIGFLAGSLLTLTFSKPVDVRSALFAAVSVPITFNYVFTPQMMAMMAPLAVVTLPLPLLALYALADWLNALALMVFFNEPEPWVLPSTSQKLFAMRNLLMAALTLTVIIMLFRRKLSPS